ncbi:MAG: hypothetical protein DI527_18225 [Chelatococcus sp.]|nr:MAG: hypothetical protein DI527_18225 [Chelatococcus sp.]
MNAMNVADMLQAEIDRAGSEKKLAERAGCSQVAINKAKHANRVSPEMAVKLEHATGVPRDRWRPDIFRPHPANDPAEGVDPDVRSS